MFHVIYTDTERMVADKATANDLVGSGKVHRHFGPEVTVEQVTSSMVKGAIKFLQIDVVEQVAKIGVTPDPVDHLLGSHHQLKQGRKCRNALKDKVQIRSEISDAKLEVTDVGAISGQFIDAIGKPMIVPFPVFCTQK